MPVLCSKRGFIQSRVEPRTLPPLIHSCSFPGYSQTSYWLLALQTLPLKHSFMGSHCENRYLNSSIAVPPVEISSFTVWEVWTTWLVLNFSLPFTPSTAKLQLVFLKSFSLNLVLVSLNLSARYSFWEGYLWLTDHILSEASVEVVFSWLIPQVIKLPFMNNAKKVLRAFFP